MRKISGYTVNIQGGGWKDWWDLQDKTRRARIRASASEYSPEDGESVNVQDEIIKTENNIEEVKKRIIETQKEKKKNSEAIKKIEIILSDDHIWIQEDFERIDKMIGKREELKKTNKELKENR